MKGTLTIVVAACLLVLPGFADAATFFSDDFNSYASDAELGGVGWWVRIDTGVPVENATWTITNPGNRVNPPTADGTPSDGNFIISDSDKASGSNPTDSNISHNIWTPAFSTVGSNGDVWLHADVGAQMNNNGSAIFDIQVTTNGGLDFTDAFTRVAPGRGTAQAATTRLPDNSNADGYYGRLDVNLGAIGEQSNVRVRMRHFEPNDDWWIAVDNVVIDDVAPISKGPVAIFAEDFSAQDGTLGAMLVDTITGGGTATWGTIDGGGRYTAGQVNAPGSGGADLDGRSVNRLMHPAAKTGRNSDQVTFAIIEDQLSPNTDDYLMTPLLDLSEMKQVFLGYDSEVITADDEPNKTEVLLMQDNGDGTPDRSDTVLATVFDYKAALHDGGEDATFAERLLQVNAAAGLENVFFAWHWMGEDDHFWAVDNIEVTGNTVPEPTSLALAAMLGLLLVQRRRNR
jgi:hypothetical protein